MTPKDSLMVQRIKEGLYEAGYTRGRIYTCEEVIIQAYLKGCTVLLLQTVRDRASGEYKYSCLYQPVSDSGRTEDIVAAIP